jgi:DNA topoisomerase-2
MYLFDDTLTPSKYKNTTDILLDYYDIRIEFYEKRKAYLLKKYEQELSVLSSKVRFINEYISGDLEINRKSKDHVLALLEEKGFPKMCSEHTDTTDNDSKKSYDYLVRMPVISMTKERIQDLETQTQNKQSQINELKKKTKVQLWKDDLQNLEKYLS